MPNRMYSDEDGTATKQSEAIYWDRIRTLCFLNSLLSFLGVGAFTLSDQYARENKSSNQLIFFTKLLWASLSLGNVIIILETAANSVCSPFYYSIAFVCIGVTTHSSYIELALGGRYYLFSLLSFRLLKELNVMEKLYSISRHLRSNCSSHLLLQISRFNSLADHTFSHQKDDPWISRVVVQPSSDTQCNGVSAHFMLLEVLGQVNCRC